MSDEDPTILDAMLSGQIDDAHGASKSLARQFQRLADFLEDVEDIKSDDKTRIEADILQAKALAIAPNYEKFARAVRAVRDITQED